MAQPASPIIGEIITLLLGGGAGAGLLKLFDTWIAKRKPPEQAAADLIELAMKASGSSVEQLLKRVADLTDEIEAMKVAHAEREAECDARLAAMQGQLRQAEQQISSLVRQLRDPNATSPGGALHGTLIEITPDDVKVTRPARTRKPK